MRVLYKPRTEFTLVDHGPLTTLFGSRQVTNIDHQELSYSPNTRLITEVQLYSCTAVLSGTAAFSTTVLISDSTPVLLHAVRYRATTHAGASSKIQLGVGHRPRNEEEDEQLQGTAVV